LAKVHKKGISKTTKFDKHQFAKDKVRDERKKRFAAREEDDTEMNME